MKYFSPLLKTLGTVMAVVMVVMLSSSASASNQSNFTQVINPGTLSVDIVDASYVTVASPAVAFTALNFSFSCQTSTGTLGTATQQIYVQNPDAADDGWNVTMAATGGATDVWDSAGTDFDFNDPNASGCTDGGDTDSLGGQLTVDPSGGTVATGNCASCATTGVSAGSSSAFDEGTTDSITLMTGAIGSDDVGDWTLQGVSLSQAVPAEQAAANDYNIDMTLTITAL